MALVSTADSIRALDGFFALHAASAPTLPPPLFLNFELATNSWEELERKRQQAELLAGTSDGGDQVFSPTADKKQVKIVYFVRHAEGFHNVAERELGTERWEAVEAKQERFLDSDLTPFGIQDTESKGPQAIETELARGMPRIGRVVVSPLSRAIQTAQHFFTPDQVPHPYVAIELSRETLGVHTCDKRRTLAELKGKFPTVDFTKLQDEQDPWWRPDHRETDEELRVRARAFLSQLFREIQEPHVAVVTHSGFISAVWSLFHTSPFHAANCEVVPLALEWTCLTQSDS